MKPLEIQEPTSLTVDDVVESLPAVGRYERQATVLVFLYFMAASFLNYNFSFFLYRPENHP